jgi:hypothetical protein
MLDSKLFNHVQQLNFTNDAAATPWSRDDRRWFKKNRRRAHRVRAAFPGELHELKGEGQTDCIVVRQLFPGARARFAFGIAACHADMVATMAGLITRGEQSEAAAHLMFDIASMHAGRWITLAELTELMSNYETAPSNDGAAMN